MTKNNLTKEEYNPYYETYISKAGSLPINEGFKANADIIVEFLTAIPKEKLEFRYAEGKWTIKEILQHIIDTERIFTYRALCIARRDKTSFPGYEQDDYVATCNANDRTMQQLIADYKSVRLATMHLFESFSEDMLTQIGIASDSRLSPRAVAHILLGHENHHCEIIKERYL